jgi:hypothetical protein
MATDLFGRAKLEAKAKLAAKRAELARVNAMIIAASDVERRALVHRGSGLRAEISTLEMLTSAVVKHYDEGSNTVSYQRTSD